MIKTLSKAQKMEREKFRIPRSVQDAIPIRRIFADGIFQVGNQYSKTWSFIGQWKLHPESQSSCF